MRSPFTGHGGPCWSISLRPGMMRSKNIFLYQEGRGHPVHGNRCAQCPGQHRILWGKASPLYDTRGNMVGAIESIRDMTERKQAEEALRESENRFRAIFNSTFQFTGMMTPDGVLMEANQAALDFAGITKEDVIGKHFWDARWWQGNEASVQQLKQAIARAAEGQFVRYEVELQGAGDTRAITDFSLKPVFGPDGKLTMLIPEGRDIGRA